MENQETAAYTEVPVTEDTAVQGNARSVPMALLTCIIALVLIYFAAVLCPKAAALIDRLFGKIPADDNKEPSAEEYKVYDIYEGDLNYSDDEPHENKE